MLTNSTVRNFFNAAQHVFQIDGNLGATAGMAECLLQSHIALHFLPALPVSWKEGNVTGLRARGGCEVDIKWNNARLTKAVVRPQFNGPVDVVGETLKVTCGGTRISTEGTGIGFAFAAEAGKSYILEPFA
jgi:alpha-L-fucosidase 2